MPRKAKRKLTFSSDIESDAPATKKVCESDEGGENGGIVGGRSRTRSPVTRSGVDPPPPPPRSQPSSTSDSDRRKGGVKKGKGKHVPVKQPAAPVASDHTSGTSVPCTSRTPQAPSPSHRVSQPRKVSLTPSKFLPLLFADEDDVDESRWVHDDDSGDPGDSSDEDSVVGSEGEADDPDDPPPPMDDDERRDGRPAPRDPIFHDFVWYPGDNFIPDVHQFDRSHSGLTNAWPCGPESTEADFFRAFFDDDIIQLIVDETNRYNEWLRNETDFISPHSRFNAWTDATMNDILVFLALTLLMPLIKKHNIRDYWSTKPMTQTPEFAKYMTRDRYQMLMSFLHFADNTLPDDTDRLWKIRPAMSKVIANFQSYFYPFQKVVIDESLVLFKGRIAFKQYIQTKRHRFGIKLFVLCDCETGFVLDMTVYTGTDKDYPKVTVNDPMGSSGSIVKTMMAPYLGKGHILYTDNWYTSPYLSQYLHMKSTGSCGTVKPNRKFMPKFPVDEQVLLPHASSSDTPDTDDQDKLTQHQKRKAKRARNPKSIIRKKNDKIIALKWVDRRDVHVLSTIHKGDVIDSGKLHHKTRKPYMKPDVIVDYTQNMRLVDKSDCMLSGIECVRKSTKWYQKIFFHLVDISMLNAYNAWLVSRSDPTKHKPFFREFVYEVVYQLLAKYGTVTSTQKGRKISTERPDRIQEAEYMSRHYPKYTETKPGTSRRYSVNCKVCALKEPTVRTRVSVICNECQVGLCIGDCWRNYHTKKNI